MKEIHYLIRAINGKSGVVYPSETDTANYYGYGGLYLVGSEFDEPDNEYKFMAVYGDELIETTAIRYRDNKNFFMVDVEKIGKFLFYAQSIPSNFPYIGSQPELEDMYAFRRIRSWRKNVLNQAVFEHNFYFVGSAPHN